MSIFQPNNPTPAIRYELLRYALKVLNREEDFDSIIKLMKPPQGITSIAPGINVRGIKVGVIS